jgi:hypothetical protein
MKKTKKKRPEIGVGCLVVNASGKIMLCKRLKPYGYGKLPPRRPPGVARVAGGLRQARGA